ncbi:MAG: hypothetical protein ACR2FY_20610 [Pirellulaceae bacterium]
MFPVEKKPRPRPNRPSPIDHGALAALAAILDRLVTHVIDPHLARQEAAVREMEAELDRRAAVRAERRRAQMAAIATAYAPILR